MKKTKISLFATEVREALNEHMRSGEPDAEILEWFNGLPKVKRKVKRWFAGSPVNQADLDEWRRAGYRSWEVRMELVEYVDELKEVAGRIDLPRLVKDLATVAATLAGE